MGDIKTTSSTKKLTIAVRRRLRKEDGQSEPMAKTDDGGEEDRYKQYNNYYDYDDSAAYDKTFFLSVNSGEDALMSYRVSDC